MTTLAGLTTQHNGLSSLGQVNGSLFARFAARAGLPGDAPLGQVVNAVHAIPYGRPGSRTAEGVIQEWKGTCSTKHALLARLLAERWPESQPRIVHRVYRVYRSSVLRRYGGVAASMPGWRHRETEYRQRTTSRIRQTVTSQTRLRLV